MERKFEIGDKVRLVSETPDNCEMTIRGYSFDIESQKPQNSLYIESYKKSLNGFVRCDWRDKNDVIVLVR